ncbi:MAG: agmatinase [Actinobacteria bacterium]|nr:agmatinase [Actinomycetota bacterium]
MTARNEYYSFATAATFCGVPAAAVEDVAGAAAAIVGAPFDWGTTGRPGARFGPKAIREGDAISATGSRPHLDSGIDALAELGVVDVGDVKMPPGYVEESLDRIIAVVEAIASAGTVPIVLGGDHTVTFANATAVARVRGADTFGLVHFDAHADTAESHHGMAHGHGTPMRRLIESGAVPGHRFVQIGLRGYWPPPETLAWMAGQGMRAFPMRDIVDRGLDAVVDEAVALASAGTGAVFVSVDIDVVDPSAAPGTGTPEPGGLSARQLLDAVNRIGRGLDVVGADIVEVSPPFDGPGAITGLLANRVVLELLDGMARRRAAAGGR